MVKKVIEVPNNYNLRAEIETRYRKGYEETPETPQLAEAQLDLTKRFITQEQW